MKFPVTLRFKHVALAPQIFLVDADGNEVGYVKQKLFKLKEHVSVFSDSSKSQLVTEIKADRIIDFSAAYSFFNSEGQEYGRVQRKGMRSLWRARYEIFQEHFFCFNVSEDNPGIRILDSIFSNIPIIGLLAGLVFNPKYNVTDRDGKVCYVLHKRPALFE
ncbi:MAG: hypothetical protein AAF558_15390, partial [Verrucomicrobiota bacterium]